jgi:hypothetical protein
MWTVCCMLCSHLKISCCAPTGKRASATCALTYVHTYMHTYIHTWNRRHTITNSCVFVFVFVFVSFSWPCFRCGCFCFVFVFVYITTTKFVTVLSLTNYTRSARAGFRCDAILCVRVSVFRFWFHVYKNACVPVCLYACVHVSLHM